MNIIIITACPSGITTSYLAAQLLEQAARQRGWHASVECHSQLTTDNAVTAADIAEADLVVVACDIELNLSRFAGVPVYCSAIAPALADPHAWLTLAEQDARPYVASSDEAKGEQGGTELNDAVHQETAQHIVAITACPTGVAHTFMAAEALNDTAARLNINIKVETQGSVGAQNTLTVEDIAKADVVIVAADIEVNTERFNGKRLYRTSTGQALKQPEQTLKQALAETHIHTTEG